MSQLLQPEHIHGAHSRHCPLQPEHVDVHRARSVVACALCPPGRALSCPRQSPLRIVRRSSEHFNVWIQKLITSWKTTLVYGAPQRSGPGPQVARNVLFYSWASRCTAAAAVAECRKVACTEPGTHCFAEPCICMMQNLLAFRDSPIIPLRQRSKVRLNTTCQYLISLASCVIFMQCSDQIKMGSRLLIF